MVKLVVLLQFLLAFAAQAEVRPVIRILSFNGDDPWQAMQTIQRPLESGFYQTETIEALFHSSNIPCGDLLNKHQSRALEVMLERGYITRSIYKALSDTALRAHQMNQYLLVTSFIEMTPHEALLQNIPRARYLEKFASKQGQEMVRIHMGSLFVVRGYNLERGANNQPQLVPLQLPWEVGEWPAGLNHALKRENIPAAIEFGRALVEEGSPPEHFHLLTQFLVSTLSADMKALNLDPRAVPVMAHAYDPTRARLFSKMMGGQPLTPDMQTQLEANPLEFLTGLKKRPRPTSWSQFQDAVVVGSLAGMIERYPVDTLSSYADRLRTILPAYVSAAERMSLVQEMAAVMRQDFDFAYHPVQIRDWGTGLLLIRFLRVLRAHGVRGNLAMLQKIMSTLKDHQMSGDPDFAQSEWMEQHFFIPEPPYKVTEADFIPGIVVSNLDKRTLPQDLPRYLGRLLVAVTDRIDSEIRSLSDAERMFLVLHMNQIRARMGLAPIVYVSLENFLETNNLSFATSHEPMDVEFKMLGATLANGFKIGGGIQSGNVDVQIDPTDIGIALEDLLRNPAVYQERLQTYAQEVLKEMILARFQPTRIYRFGWAEVVEQRGEWPDLAESGASSVLTHGEYHRQKMLRFYITYH